MMLSVMNVSLCCFTRQPCATKVIELLEKHLEVVLGIAFAIAVLLVSTQTHTHIYVIYCYLTIFRDGTEPTE